MDTVEYWMAEYERLSGQDDFPEALDAVNNALANAEAVSLTRQAIVDSLTDIGNRILWGNFP